MSKKSKKIKEKKIPRFVAAKDVPKYISVREYIDIGNVKINNNFETEAGQKLDLSKKWFQRLVYVNQFILLLSLLAAFMIFVFLSNNESPTVFANFNTGKLMCSNEPISLNNNKAIGRESEHYQSLCKELADFNEDIN